MSGDTGVKGGIKLVTGGARSGKSVYAERLAMGLPGKRAYIATACALDDEMRERIRRHKSRRGSDWLTVEEPIKVASRVANLKDYRSVLIDCLTLWLSNLLADGLGDAVIMEEVGRLVSVSSKSGPAVIAVTNEVGLGIVPDNPLARRFRDLSGLMNQAFAEAADEVYLVTAGIPLRIK